MSNTALDDFGIAVMEQMPEMREVMVDASLTPQEKLVRMLHMMRDKPEMQQTMMQLAGNILVPSPMGPDRGLPRLDPQYESALKERLAFDGDAPELRFGPLGPKGKPAVPVVVQPGKATTWEIGAALEQASAYIRHMLDKNEEEAIAQAHDVGQDAVTALTRDMLPELPEYPTGRLPQPLEVDIHVTDASAETKRRWAFAALSTTQGRRSIASYLSRVLVTELGELGYTVEAGAVSSNDGVVYENSWTMQLYGPEMVQEHFDVVQTVKQQWVNGMGERLENGVRYTLNVQPVNDIADRRMGWEIKCVSSV